MKKYFEIGDSVLVKPKDGDFNHEFIGTIVYISDFIRVIDQDDVGYYVDYDQVSHSVTPL